MQRKIKGIFIVILASVLFCLFGCSDGKSPESGYISIEEVDEIVDNFQDKTVTKYSYSGELNYFDYSNDIIPSTINKSGVDYTEAADNKYSLSCSSYYLRLPLHITKDNWYYLGTDNNISQDCTRYHLESKIHQIKDSIDEVYYYSREGGGFYIKAFGVNKPLVIFKTDSITCHAKWNIVCEYDEYGYLVSEEFETLNSSSNNKSECCYGYAKYSY